MPDSATLVTRPLVSASPFYAACSIMSLDTMKLWSEIQVTSVLRSSISCHCGCAVAFNIVLSTCSLFCSAKVSLIAKQEGDGI